MKKPFIEPYLIFGGRCEEALEFYQTAVGAQVAVKLRFSENPEPPPPGALPPGMENRIMHSVFRIGETAIMASDGCGDPAKFEGFSLSLGVATEAEADQAFAALSEGGKVEMPLTKTFWSPRFGMVTDKFGVSWMVNVMAPSA